MMPLTMGNTGDVVVIKKITGKDEIRQHLAEMGLVVEETVKIVNRMGGNLIIQVKESRVAIDQSMANRILF